MTIGELTKRTGIGEHTLRFYEKKGLIRVPRDGQGRRFYTEKDIEWVRFIKRLKDTGMLLKDIKIYADLRYEGDHTAARRLEILRKHREYVEEQRRKWDEYLENLDAKIDIYEEMIK